MEYIATAKNIKISPRKMRLVVDGVKKQSLNQALASLMVMNKRASNPIKKVLDAAVANAVNNFKADKKGLSIKDIMVTEGLAMK
ncbi:MAG TPA: uL22 family ribosomal protein, partial [Patescibacteria group bacterium]|nr:uL22 family ribosomal protein [Patescibacteria group bacterium]